jgi:hypothetical protein
MMKIVRGGLGHGESNVEATLTLGNKIVAADVLPV